MPERIEGHLPSLPLKETDLRHRVGNICVGGGAEIPPVFCGVSDNNGKTGMHLPVNRQLKTRKIQHEQSFEPAEDICALP